ncbi:MAG: bifunctional adenosylcobinamide kinase/adenosylcobinamide-phosphate guanylyltransferase [Clostridiaceae bacterium]
MGRLILVTGGARSGKSSFAEETVRGFGGSILYIATAIAFDDEMKERIRRHRLQRPADWETLEAFRDFGRVLPDRLDGRDAVLLDCVTVMVSNIMLQRSMDWEGISVEEINKVEQEVTEQVDSLLAIINGADIPFLLVTNEVGMGVVPPTVLGRAMRDIAGRVNRQLARAADEVYLCVSGIPVKIK